MPKTARTVLLISRTLAMSFLAGLAVPAFAPLSAQSASSPATAGPTTLMQAPLGHTPNAQHFDVLEVVQSLQQDSVGISRFRAEYKTTANAAALAGAEPLRSVTPGPPSTISVQRLLHHPPKAALKAFARGVTAERKARQTEAIEHFTTAVSLDPSYVEARAALGVAYARVGEVSKALEQFERGLALEPNSSVLHFNRALALLSLGRAAEAEREAQYVLVLNPQDVAAPTLIRLASLAQGRP
jgi:Flp pilus assembly protein TadD